LTDVIVMAAATIVASAAGTDRLFIGILVVGGANSWISAVTNVVYRHRQGQFGSRVQIRFDYEHEHRFTAHEHDVGRCVEEDVRKLRFPIRARFRQSVDQQTNAWDASNPIVPIRVRR
jgi:hypothetical protein